MNEKLLTHEEALKIAGALARLNELNSTPALVISDGNPPADTEQEKRDLVAFLAESLISHGGELLGNYFALQNEYAPLVRALVPVVQRVMTGLNNADTLAVRK